MIIDKSEYRTTCKNAAQHENKTSLQTLPKKKSLNVIGRECSDMDIPYIDIYITIFKSYLHALVIYVPHTSVHIHQIGKYTGISQ